MCHSILKTTKHGTNNNYTKVFRFKPIEGRGNETRKINMKISNLNQLRHKSCPLGHAIKTTEVKVLHEKHVSLYRKDALSCGMSQNLEKNSL